MSLKVTCLGEGLGTMTTEVAVGDLPDVFDIEFMLLKHTNGHDIGIPSGSSNQTPDRSISGIDSLDISRAGLYTRIPSLNRFLISARLSSFDLVMSRTWIS